MVIDGQFKHIAELVALFIQAGAVLVVTFGAVQAISLVAAAIWQREADSPRGREIWLKFATWILPSPPTLCARRWRRPGTISAAVIATIRTMLNYFLAKDIASFDQSRDEGPKPRAARRA
jgi:uncharacterized membrane protein